MMSIELGIFIAVLASFGLGIYLGYRGKPALNEQVSLLKAKVRAMDNAMAKTLDEVRNYRTREEEHGKSHIRSHERITQQEKLLERIKETLATHRLRYDVIYGWIEPIDGSDYKYTIEVSRKSNEELEKQQVAAATRPAEVFVPKQLQQPKPRPHAPAARTSPATRPETNYSRHQDDSTLNTVMQAAVLSSVLDNSRPDPTPEPVRCDAPDVSQSYDSSPCSSPTFD